MRFLEQLAKNEGYDSFGHKLWEEHPDSVELEKMFEQVLLEYALERSYSIATDKEQAKREIAERGFDDSETWSLEVTFAKFMLPRFIRFRELHKERIAEDAEFVEAMNDIRQMLEVTAKDVARDNEKIVDKGLEAFKNYFFRLWW